MSLGLVALVSVLAAVYGLAAAGVSVLAYVYTANFGFGVILLISGLFWITVPTQLYVKKGPLVDHTTYGEKFLAEQKRKRLRGVELIYVGICNIVITAALQQIVMWVI